ncbi:hypothetical protein Tco_0929686 [Tanacetum coccineum]
MLNLIEFPTEDNPSCESRVCMKIKKEKKETAVVGISERSITIFLLLEMSILGGLCEGSTLIKIRCFVGGTTLHGGVLRLSVGRDRDVVVFGLGGDWAADMEWAVPSLDFGGRLTSGLGIVKWAGLIIRRCEQRVCGLAIWGGEVAREAGFVGA